MSSWGARGRFVILALAVAGCSALIGFDQPAEQGAQCSDGVDNDGNGRRDCEEPSCVDSCVALCGEGIAADSRGVDPATGHCYLGFATGLGVIQANETCMGLGGYLAVPDNAAEDALVRGIAPPAASLGFADFYSAAVGYDFRQVTGDRVATYLNFSPGQPDEDPGAPAICVSYDGVQPTWQDNDCETPRPYICEVTPRTCGDLVRQPSEGCDDGNAAAGDGCAPSCVDEDECALGTDNCDANADCFNQPWNRNQPGFVCGCRSGFVGDGVTCTALPPPPTFETRAPAPLSTALSGCSTATARRGRKIAVDLFGALYIAVRCGTEARVLVSVDAGATWSAPQVVGTNVDEVAVIGIGQGRAVVAMTLASGDVVVRQTLDFGATWGPVRPVFAGADIVPGLSLATDHADLFVGLHSAAGAYRVHRSTDPMLASFTGVDTLSVGFGDVLVNPQAPSQVFAVGDTENLHVLESQDGGFTFPGPPVSPSSGAQQLSDWAFGGGAIFVTGTFNSVGRLRTTALDTVELATGLREALAGERTIAADDAGNAFVAYADIDGNVVVVRLPAGTTELGATVTVEPMGEAPSLAVVPGALVALVYVVAGEVRFAVVDPTFNP